MYLFASLSYCTDNILVGSVSSHAVTSMWFAFQTLLKDFFCSSFPLMTILHKMWSTVKMQRTLEKQESKCPSLPVLEGLDQRLNYKWWSQNWNHICLTTEIRNLATPCCFIGTQIKAENGKEAPDQEETVNKG